MLGTGGNATHLIDHSQCIQKAISHRNVVDQKVVPDLVIAVSKLASVRIYYLLIPL